MSVFQVFTMYSIKKGFNQDKGVRYVAGVCNSGVSIVRVSAVADWPVVDLYYL